MGAVGDVGEGTTTAGQENRGHHGHVGQMRSARERVVQDRDVTGTERHGGDRRAHGQRRRPQVDGNVRRLRDQPAAGVEQRAREVTSLLDVGRQRRAAEDDAHLLRDGRQTLIGDGERDGVHQPRPSTSPAVRSTCRRQPGGTTVVALYSQTMSGPRTRQPTGRSARR